MTIVVAHRLNTLEQAQAILDSSLFETQKELTFVSRSELLDMSDYYRDLQAGKAYLEE